MWRFIVFCFEFTFDVPYETQANICNCAIPAVPSVYVLYMYISSMTLHPELACMYMYIHVHVVCRGTSIAMIIKGQRTLLSKPK